ncbi:MAG TPA: penicillin-binding transpeptidase domain-containing protein, partial [Micavibrio sp.]
PEERAGLMPTTQWKRQNMADKVWHPGESIVCSIGQGYVQATPLQLAVMTARIVNGGLAVKPWITGYVGDKPTHTDPWPRLNVKPAHLKLAMDGMDHVVNYPGGTAMGSRINTELHGVGAMGGKTGTSQVKRITADERARGVRQEDLPWKYRHHALFVGYAPVDNPRYVCAVVVEHGGGGSAVAAPIARDLLIETQKLNPASNLLRPASAATTDAASGAATDAKTQAGPNTGAGFPPRKPDGTEKQTPPPVNPATVKPVTAKPVKAGE